MKKRWVKLCSVTNQLAATLQSWIGWRWMMFKVSEPQKDHSFSHTQACNSLFKGNKIQTPENYAKRMQWVSLVHSTMCTVAVVRSDGINCEHWYKRHSCTCKQSASLSCGVILQIFVEFQFFDIVSGRPLLVNTRWHRLFCLTSMFRPESSGLPQETLWKLKWQK